MNIDFEPVFQRLANIAHAKRIGLPPSASGCKERVLAIMGCRWMTCIEISAEYGAHKATVLYLLKQMPEKLERRKRFNPGKHWAYEYRVKLK